MRAVQRSFISFVFQWPVLIIGSMVKIIPACICGPSPRLPKWGTLGFVWNDAVDPVAAVLADDGAVVRLGVFLDRRADVPDVLARGDLRDPDPEALARAFHDLARERGSLRRSMYVIEVSPW